MNGKIVKPLLGDSKILHFRANQCCGSVSFWYGSGSESADPVPMITDTDPDPGQILTKIQSFEISCPFSGKKDCEMHLPI